MNLTLSSELQSYLNLIDNPVKDLLLQSSNKSFDYLDIERKDNNVLISYLPIEKLDKTAVGCSYWTTALRQAVKIGRVINKLNDDAFTEDQVRNFTETLLAFADTNTYRIEVVEGEEIGRIYRLPASDTVNPHHTRPFGSCFQGTLTEERCKFWDINPEIVKMIVIWVKDKLAGRALVWYGKIKGSPELAPRLDNVFSGLPQARALILKKAADLNIVNNVTKGWYNKDWSAIGEPATTTKYFDFVTYNDGKITLKEEYVNYVPETYV